jgi:hypothetical protein
MLVGYNLNHACDIYSMLDLNTKYIIKSCNIAWVNKSFGEWDKKAEAVNNIFDDHDEDEDEVIEEKSPEPKVQYEMKKQQRWLNPESSRIVESWKSGREMILVQADIVIMMLEGPMEQGYFDED